MLWAPFALATLAVVTAQNAPVHLGLIDNKQASYLSAASSGAEYDLTAEGAACIEASLLGLPCASSSNHASAQAEFMLKPNVFERPQALLSLQVAGKPLDLEAIAGSHAMRTGELAQGTSALEVSTGLQAVAAMAQAELDVYHADYATLPGCSDACMEALLQDALLAINGNYSAGEGGPMRGIANVWQTAEAGSQAVSLDLQQLPVRLWAAELAVLRHTASEMSTERSRREAQGSQNVGSSWLLEGVMVGLQALSQNSGISSAQYAGAELAVQKTISQAQDTLSRAFDDRVVTEIAMLGTVATSSNGLQSLLQWRAASQSLSSKAAATWPFGGTLPSGGRDSLNWQTDSAAWLSFIIIVAFLGAGIYVLTNMQFKKDSLLYGRSKAD